MAIPADMGILGLRAPVPRSISTLGFCSPMGAKMQLRSPSSGGERTGIHLLLARFPGHLISQKWSMEDG